MGLNLGFQNLAFWTRCKVLGGERPPPVLPTCAFQGLRGEVLPRVHEPRTASEAEVNESWGLGRRWFSWEPTLLYGVVCFLAHTSTQLGRVPEREITPSVVGPSMATWEFERATGKD